MQAAAIINIMHYCDPTNESTNAVSYFAYSSNIETITHNMTH